MSQGPGMLVKWMAVFFVMAVLLLPCKSQAATPTATTLATGSKYKIFHFDYLVLYRYFLETYFYLLSNLKYYIK